MWEIMREEYERTMACYTSMTNRREEVGGGGIFFLEPSPIFWYNATRSCENFHFLQAQNLPKCLCGFQASLSVDVFIAKRRGEFKAGWNVDVTLLCFK